MVKQRVILVSHLIDVFIEQMNDDTFCLGLPCSAHSTGSIVATRI